LSGFCAVRPIWMAVLVALAFTVFGLVGCEGAANDGSEAKSPTDPEQSAGEKTAARRECRPNGPTDSIIADPAGITDKELVKSADNIFVGRVIGKVDGGSPTENTSPLPETSFSVVVERNVRGTLSGTVTVRQAGGCDPRYGRVVIVNDDPLLRAGERVVFSTSEDPSGGTHSIVGHNYGDMRVDTRRQEESIVARLLDGRREYVPYGVAKRGT
jgi:hypothetical protein